MKLHFKNQTLSYELLRAIGYATYGGADIGECLATAGRIREGNLESWHVEWQRTAERVRAQAEEACAAGHRISAREAFLRASNYYRTAEFFLHVNPSDPRVLSTWRASRDTFRAAASLFEPAFEAIEIPFEGTTLPGYFISAGGDSLPRPTLILHGGFDSTVEELYFAGAAAALRRGYNCLMFDGPGQGGALRERGIRFRPNWETVLSPVVDYALARPEVESGRVALMGWSLGGLLAARAAAFEHRLSALILFNGVYDVYANVMSEVPPILRWLLGRRGLANAMLEVGMRTDVSKRWALTHGMWTGGFSSPAEYFQSNRQYTLDGIATKIQCPTLVCDAEHDQFFRDARSVFAALSCPKEYALFTSEDGAEEHCQAGALSRFHQRAFDWLDATIGPFSDSKPRTDGGRPFGLAAPLG